MTASLADPDPLLLGYPEVVPPAYLSYPRHSRTFGPEVADLCDSIGYGPDPEQRMLLDLIFAFDTDTGVPLPSSFETAVLCCRQNLKTGLFKQAAIGWMFITDERLVLWSAHEFSTSSEAFGDLDELITGSDMLRRRVKTIHRSHGEEAIELRPLRAGERGGRLKFKARTKSGGRGLTGDKVVLDEAFALIPSHMGTLLPTLSTRVAAQVLYGSSAGLAYSDVLRGVRDRGRSGKARRMTYVEWCDPTTDEQRQCRLPKCNHHYTQPGCVLDEQWRWKAANPAIGRRISLAHIVSERQAMPAEEFARERLGWWDDPLRELPISPAGFAQLGDPKSGLAKDSLRVFAIDASPGGRSAAITVTGKRPDGKLHIEVVSHAPGTAWVEARAVELNNRHEPAGWALDPGGAAGALLPDLKRAGLNITELGAREMGQACASLSALVLSDRLAHREVPTDADPSAGPLTRAISGAGRRDIGDGLWGWLRRRSDTDICPIVAATESTWLYSVLQPGEDDDPGVYFI